ncbi:hypothetical protein Btru_070369 [Bulinus truncatus]|nr:hypothetical protein Btru_070369 [Bulinus truncatus]
MERPNVSGYEHMTGFYVQGYNTEGQILFHYRDNGENARNPTVWILTHGSYSTDKIVVSLDNPDGKRHLELCEIEAFGGCSPLDGGGVYCNSACDNDTCWDGVCHGDHCVVCIAGLDFEGRCIVVKSPPCVEKDRSRMWLLMAIDIALFIVGIIMGVYSL